MLKIILIRHGETNKNVQGVLHRRNDEEGLSKLGITQIEKTAEKLKEELPFVLYSSDEKRSRQSANIIAEALNVEAHVLRDVHERDWGDLSGKPWGEIQAILEKLTLNERFEYIPPKGESWKAFEERLGSAVEKVLSEQEEKTVVIVTHGGAIRALIPYLLKIAKEESFKYDPDNASISIFLIHNGEKRAEVINDTSHLRGV